MGQIPRHVVQSTESPHVKAGKVFLVGAGPGDPGLLTLRGMECLRQADVVLFDYLVNPRILEHALADAEQICLGQHGHSRIWTQDEINDRMVALARQGKNVVRLKGGDPGVFARGVEEIAALVQAKVAFEIVPGVTAAMAAASYAGIPLTHREHASAVALVTGQEDIDKEVTALDYHALAEFPGTLVFYMGVTTARNWSTRLIEAGKPPDTPTAIVRRCSFPDQRVIRCTLAEVADRIEQVPRIRPPAIVIVGSVAAASENPGWFEQRPLFGQRIVVTRPREPSEKLGAILEELGAEVIAQPAIEIVPPADWTPVDRALERLPEFDWLVFSSAKGVFFLLKRLLEIGLDLRALKNVRLAAIGPGTAEALNAFHLRADLQPDEFRAESLAKALSSGARGQRLLLARASRGREVLADELQAAGAHVEQAVVYQSLDVTAPDEHVTQLISAGKIDWLTVTSSAIARSVVRMFGERLRATKLVSISPITSATLRELGHEPTAEAKEYTMAGVVAAIVKKAMTDKG